MTNSPDNRQAKLNELYELGKSKGKLTYKEIMNALMEMDMDPDQLDKVLETLEALGVEVVNELDPQPEAEPATPKRWRTISPYPKGSALMIRYACTSRRSARFPC